MDISDTIIADSTQINAADLAEPVTVTITNVSKGNSEQPVNLHVAEFPGKAFRPCKTVRRILVKAWGKDASVYVGRRMTIYNDDRVRWGGQQVGGVRVSALSHIDGPLMIPVTVARGKTAVTEIQPLSGPEDHTGPLRTTAPSVTSVTPEEIEACASVEKLREWWQTAPDMRGLISERVKLLEHEGGEQ